MDPMPEAGEEKERPIATYVGCFGVSAMIAIAVAMFVPTRGATDRALATTARDDEKAILRAVKVYYEEYGKLPVDPNASGVLVLSGNNSALFDVLRNRTGQNEGNALNPQNMELLHVPEAMDQHHPRSGLQTASGVWFDSWGTPYHVAIDTHATGTIDCQADIPGFYTDVGKLKHLDVLVWSYGKNGKLGGGPALKAGFSDEGGTAGRLAGSDDVVSWK